MVDQGWYHLGFRPAAHLTLTLNRWEAEKSRLVDPVEFMNF